MDQSNVTLISVIYEQGVYHTVALPFTTNKYLKAKEELWKSYGNSNISPCKTIIFKKIL
jgi:hypothetical protein